MNRCFVAASLLIFAAAASAAEKTYVFPRDGFRYTQAEDETVLTRTNLQQYTELLTQLGTTPEAVLASYDSSGIAMEVITSDGAQIGVGVSEEAQSSLSEMTELQEAEKNGILNRFAESGLYSECGFSAEVPDYMRLTSSAMYGTMPIWQLRYVTLHLGSFLTISKTIVGREPEAEDDAEIVKMIGRIKLLSVRAHSTPTPAPAETVDSTPEPVRSENAAKLTITEPKDRTFTGEKILIRGVTEANTTVTATADGFKASVKSNKNGVFSVPVTMPEAGSKVFTLRVSPKDKEESVQTVSLTRVLTDREQLAAFKASQTQATYSELTLNPEKYSGKNLIFRGKVMDFTDYDGRPCALICVSNPQTGIWRDPLYAVLSLEDEVNAGDVLTFYLVGEGFTLPASGEYTTDGNEFEAPVASVFRYTANR